MFLCHSGESRDFYLGFCQRSPFAGWQFAQFDTSRLDASQAGRRSKSILAAQHRRTSRFLPSPSSSSITLWELFGGENPGPLRLQAISTVLDALCQARDRARRGAASTVAW